MLWPDRHESFCCYLGAKDSRYFPMAQQSHCQKDASDGTDKSIDDLIADADAYILSLQRKMTQLRVAEGDELSLRAAAVKCSRLIV